MYTPHWYHDTPLSTLWDDVVEQMTYGPIDTLIHALQLYHTEATRLGFLSDARESLIQGLINLSLAPSPPTETPTPLPGPLAPPPPEPYDPDAYLV